MESDALVMQDFRLVAKRRPIAFEMQDLNERSNKTIQTRVAVDGSVIDDVSRTWANVVHHLILWAGLVAVVYIAGPLIFKMGEEAIAALVVLVIFATICQAVKWIFSGATDALARRWK